MNRTSPVTIKNGKAVGLDNINSEVLKVDTAITVEMLYPLLEKIRSIRIGKKD
jgi:hypothetical protein